MKTSKLRIPLIAGVAAGALVGVAGLAIAGDIPHRKPITVTSVNVCVAPGGDMSLATTGWANCGASDKKITLKGTPGPRGLTGARGATGATGPSNAYWTSSFGALSDPGHPTTLASLTLPAGNYLLSFHGVVGYQGGDDPMQAGEANCNAESSGVGPDLVADFNWDTVDYTTFVRGGLDFSGPLAMTTSGTVQVMCSANTFGNPLTNPATLSNVTFTALKVSTLTQQVPD